MIRHYSTADFKKDLKEFTRVNGNIKDELDKLTPVFQEAILKGESEVKVRELKNLSNVAVSTGFPFIVESRAGYANEYIFDISELYEPEV